MVPEPAPDEGSAGPGDVAAGLLRTLWPWIVAVLAVVGFVVFLLWGSNEPDDPEIRGAGARTASTPADGLRFDEVLRLVGDECLELLVADDFGERVAGLRGREGEVQRVDGMLFVTPEPTTGPSAFTMSGVTAPLDIGFYDESGASIGRDEMEPCPEGGGDCTYPAPEGWKFAIETAPDRLPEGDLGGTCSKRRAPPA